MSDDQRMTNTEQDEGFDDADQGDQVDDRGDGDEGEGDVARETQWGEDWRRELAGDDRQVLSRLERMASPRVLLESYLNAEKRLHDGSQQTVLTPPGEHATDAELAAWREAAGIPEAPDGYSTELEDGRQLGEEDAPIFDHFSRAAFEANMPKEMMGVMVGAYLDLEEQEQTALMEDDQAHYERSDSVLRDEWGPDYQRNMGAIFHLFAGASEQVPIEGTDETISIEDAILGARMPNGRKIGGDAAALAFLNRIGLELLPAGEDIPDGETSGALDDRLAEITKIMSTDPDRYDQDKALQKEHEELIEARLKRERRNQAAA